MSFENESTQTGFNLNRKSKVTVNIASGAPIADLVVPLSHASVSSALTRATYATGLPVPGFGYTSIIIQITGTKFSAGVLQCSLNNSSWVPAPETLCHNSDSSGNTNAIAAYTGGGTSQIIVVDNISPRLLYRISFESLTEATFSVDTMFDGRGLGGRLSP